MQLKNHIFLMTEYNQSMNINIFAIVEKLSPAQLNVDCGAFFGSVFGTLNHIAVGDTLWLKRFSSSLHSHAALDPVRELKNPESLESTLCENLHELSVRRSLLDEVFLNFAESITDAELIESVTYRNMKGEIYSKNLFSLLMHVFNHQTHHRGQVTTLLSQFGLGYGVTDLAAYIPNM